MRALIPVMLLLAVLGLGCKKKAGDKAPLDGKTFTLKVVGQPDDTVIFSGGKLASVGCRQYGFAPSPYRVTKSGPGWKFTSNATSAKEGKNFWSGTVAGGNIMGTLKWEKPGQKAITYAFTGSLKK